MRRAEFDTVLTAMMESHPGVSDLLFSVGRPFQVESFGELKPVDMRPEIFSLTPSQTERIALNIIGDDRRLIKELLMMGSCDCSYSLNDQLRFRVNIFKQRGYFAIVMRKPQAEIPTLSSLGMQPIFQDIAREKNGLILVTGATGSGKTTTLSAILNEINETQASHVVTLEDPIEFVHKHKSSTFSQRELGQDFDDYPSGLRAALRQAPKVILLGEMRDRATVEIALMAAETGHLVLSTLHTIDAGQSINRILGLFELAEETQLRLRLADTVRYIASQRLAPKCGGGRLMLNEVMGTNLRIREAIAFGENEHRSFYDIIESNASFGWQTFDQSIARAYNADLITEETAHLYATRKGTVSRAIDVAKKRRGVAVDSVSGMRLDTPEGSMPSFALDK
ncbi:MAG: twitching motility protein PilT [Chthoniobacter sp.]|jgi:twitching motility protein PilT|nr:twitching motility protein PilT [Chthoniobacter sp.]